MEIESIQLLRIILIYLSYGFPIMKLNLLRKIKKTRNQLLKFKNN